jgi:hypothetical protein
MNKDLARTVHSKDTYLNARNIRINTDDQGQSFGGAINVLGNEQLFAFPSLSNVFTFNLSGTPSYTITLTINSVGYNFTITQTDVEDQVVELVGLINDDAALTALGVVAAPYSCDSVYLTSTTAGLALTLTSVDPEVTNITEIIPELSDFYILGDTAIREDLYLITTSTTGATGGDGQIWKVTVDDITGVATVTILYNNLMNLTTDHPIQMLGRYENSGISKIYWTDDFNPLRNFQVDNDNTFLTTLDQLDLIGIVDNSAIQITDVIVGGDLFSGVYQLIYRLSATSGNKTAFSMPSSLVNIVSADDSASSYKDYVGETSGNSVNKAICFKIDGLDTNYDFVEVAAIYYGDDTSLPIISSFLKEPISDTGLIEGCYSGTEGGTEDLISDEINAITSPFTHAKTIASKDNRLLAGNVRKEALDITFDARAYAHQVSSTTFNIDGAAETVFANIDETANANNDDYTVNKFKQSSTTYGGTGTYVEYEIKTSTILADQKIIGSGSSSYESNPGRDIYSINSDITIGGYVHPGFSPVGMRYPNTFGLLRGYQRDEIYRFAIVFFNKTGDADFAQWIGDIKIPPSYDTARIVYGTDGYINGNFDGKLIRRVGNEWFMNIPYIDFQVTLTQDIKDKISGYSIVRVERTDADKTIVGQGMAHLASRKFNLNDSPDSRSVASDLETGEHIFLTNNNPDPSALNPQQKLVLYTGNYNSSAVQDDVITVDFPEHLFGDNINFSTGDKLKTVDVLSSNGSSSNTDTFDYNFKVNPSTIDYSIKLSKYYEVDSTNTTLTVGYDTPTTVDVDEFHKVPRSGSVTLDNGDIFKNETFNSYTGGDAWYGGYGEQTILIKTSAPLYDNLAVFNAANLNSATHSDTAYIVNYYRTLTNQYGGDSYSQRTNNVYISTNHYQDIDCDTPLTTSSEVYGGDTSMSVMHMQKIIKPWKYDELSFGALSPEGSGVIRKLSEIKWWPVESTINVDLRHGGFFEKDGLNDNGTLVDNGENFFYNEVFSREGNTRKFFPKPLEFSTIEEYDTRVYASDAKINGETTNSWGNWPVNQFIDVEGLYGPLNNLAIFNDAVIYHQDYAFGILSVNPRALMQDSEGFNLELGVGGILHDYNYVSTQIGSKHQWGIITAKNAIYWLDISTKKFYRFTGQGVEPLSDIKGMFSFLNNNLDGTVKLPAGGGNGDNPLAGGGINGYYDSINNEVVMTFHNAHRIQIYNFGTTYKPGDYVKDTASPFATFHISTEFTAAGSSTAELTANSDDPGVVTFNNDITLAYSEFANAFTSFYDFSSPMYITHKDLILSQNTINNEVYRHNSGEYCEFYGNIFASTLKFISNELPTHTKTFDNLEWHHQVLDYNRDVKDDTFDTLTCTTDYQTTGNIGLSATVAANIRRKERTWKIDVPRSTTNLERLRDKAMEVEFSYSNIDGYRMLLNYVNTVFRVSAR